KKIPLLLGGIFTFLTTSRRSVICSEVFGKKPSKSYKAVFMQLTRQDLDKKNSFESKGKNYDVYYRKHETFRGILEKNPEK
ncbi:MAG TPA: hypothetical protein VFY68_02325, partial [Nitrososphaeraceae archaeon]|nr:hypothetical protein [Nitrososphaeraceae archaeon]